MVGIESCFFKFEVSPVSSPVDTGLIFLPPVRNNFLGDMGRVEDLKVETRTVSKGRYYTSSQMARTSYSNRKIRIIF